MGIRLSYTTTPFQRVKHPVVAGTYPTFVTKILLNLSEKHVGATVILDVKRRSFEDTVLSEIIMDAEGTYV